MRVTIPQGLLRASNMRSSSNEGDSKSNDGVPLTALLCGRRLDDGDVLQSVGTWTPPSGDTETIEDAIRSRLGAAIDQDELCAQSQYYQIDTSERIEGLIPITTSEADVSRLLEFDEVSAVVFLNATDGDREISDDALTVRTRETSDNDGDDQHGDVDIIRYETDAFSRNQSLLDSDLLEDAVVTVVGLGTGGGKVAVELSKAGVGEFRLVDFDRLETHNITRHVCGLSDVGRLKTRAVRDQLLDINPNVTVETHEIDVVESRSIMMDVLEGSDLVVGATDSEVSKLAINRTCVDAGVPAVYAGAYERAFGGDVIRVIPEETPCYDCVLGDLQESLDYTDETESIDYAEVEDPENFTAEPGLSVDVGFISLIQTNYALLTLLRDTESDLEDYEQNMCFWGNRPDWIFEEPLQSQFAETRFRDNCPTCQRERYFAEEHGITEAEAKDRVADIVSDADSLEVSGIGEDDSQQGDPE